MALNLDQNTKNQITNIKKQLQGMIERKMAGSLVDQFRSQEQVLIWCKGYKPQEWNNIPIPLKELSNHQIQYDNLVNRTMKMMQNHTDELTYIASIML